MTLNDVLQRLEMGVNSISEAEWQQIQDFVKHTADVCYPIRKEAHSQLTERGEICEN